REQQARAQDNPRSWILDNDLALDLARNPPADGSDLQARLDSTPKAPRKLGEALWQALTTALGDEAEMPAIAAEPDRNAVRKLQDAVARRSAALGLPDGVLASRKYLEALLESGDWPQPLHGCRQPELEPLLQPLLARRGAAGQTRRPFRAAHAPAPAVTRPPAGPRCSHVRRAGPAAGRGPARSREHLPPDAVPVPHHAQRPPFRPPARPAGGYGRGRPEPPVVAAAQPLAGMEAGGGTGAGTGCACRGRHR